MIEICLDLDMNEIIPRLFLGSQKATMDASILELLGITHILSVGAPARNCPANSVNRYIDIRDSHEQDLLAILPEAVEFIKDGMSQEQGKVFVHCLKGISRSTSCIMAYLINSQQITQPEAF